MDTADGATANGSLVCGNEGRYTTIMTGRMRKRIHSIMPYAIFPGIGLIFGATFAWLEDRPIKTGVIVGNIVGTAISLVLLILLAQYRSRSVRQEQQAYVQQARRERQVVTDRLHNVAWAEDLSYASVHCWSAWPPQLHAAMKHASFPAVVRFRLPDDYWPSQTAREDFAEHLHEATGVELKSGLQWLVRWDIPRQAVWAEIALAKIDAPYPDDWPALEHPRLIPIGKRRDGERRFWNADADPMGAIAGRTGTGKTVGIGTLVIGCGRAGWDVYLVDGKMTGLGIFRNRHGVRAVAVEPDGPGGWWTVIDTVYRELQHRKRTLARGESIADRPSILLVVDEVPTVLAFRRGRTADVLRWNEPRREAQRKLTEIAMQGRSLDIHYWPAGQRLAAIVVEGVMRENLSALLVFRSTLVGSIQAMESTAAARLPKMPGRAVWTDVASDGEEIQVYRWTAEDLDRLLPLEGQRSAERTPVVDAFGFQEVTHSG